MRNFITIAEGHKILTEATFDKEIDKIVATVLRGSAGHSKGKMINRDAVLNKGFDMALALDDGKDNDNIFTGIKNFVVTDDFLERQYFGKIAKRLGLKGMFMNNGRYITTDVDEFDRYELGRGDNDDAIDQNNKGLLPGKVAKKYRIDLKMKGAADDAQAKDSKPGKEWRIQSNGKRSNFNIDRTAPYVDKINKDNVKVRTYGSVEQLKKFFGDDAKIKGTTKVPGKEIKTDVAKDADKAGGITITNDNILKYVDRYEELLKKAQKGEVMMANVDFRSVFGDLYKQLNEEKLSDAEELELQQIVDAMNFAIKNKTINDHYRGYAQDLVDKWKYDKEIAIAAEKEKAKASFDAAANKAKAAKSAAGKDADVDPAQADLDGEKTAQDINKDVMGDPAIYDPDFDKEKEKKKKDSTPRGALAKFAKSGKGGLANDTDEVDAIKELQSRLKDMGIEMSIDGKYGKGTVDAVKRLQEMLGAKQDGDAGPNTIGAMEKMGNIPGVITFYDDLKRMAELSKQVKAESQEFRYFMNILEGGNLLEALSAAEQKEYSDLLAKHKAKFDDTEYQMTLPKSVKDLMGQVIKNDPKGVASATGAGQDADAGKGRFIPLPQDILDYLGLPPATFYIDTLMDESESDFYIVKDPVGKRDRVRSISGGKQVYVRNTQTMAKVTEPEGQMVKDFLDGQGIPYGKDIKGYIESGSEDLSTPLSDAKPASDATDDGSTDAKDDGSTDAKDDGSTDAKDQDGQQSDKNTSKKVDQATGGEAGMAAKLYQAMKGGFTGAGTDEVALFEVFEQITTNQQYKAVSASYLAQFKSDLYTDLEDEIDPGEFYKKDGKVIGTAKQLIFDKIANLASAKADGSTVGKPKASDTTTSQAVDQDGGVSQGQDQVNTSDPNAAAYKDGQAMGAAAASTTDQTVDKTKQPKASVKPRPLTQGGRNKMQDRWDRLYGATHNPDGSPKNENKEYDMTKKVNEAASMNISMNGDNSTEVAELVALLRNAGMEKAEPVSDMPMYKDKHDDMVSKIQMMDPEGPMDSPSPCGMGEEDVGEEWDNSPDEEYKDDDYMTRDIAGGLNRPKPPGALRAKDPAIHNEEVDKYRAQLAKGLEEAYGKFTYKKTANGYEFGGKTYKSEKEARTAEQQAKLKKMG